MRKGSALLIVLGMLSFMVISAVSFSMYMRQTRMPSSYLRRNIAARHLVRASLARAIEELEGDFNEDRNWGKYDIDEDNVERSFYGIYDDPYPGCGWKPSSGTGESAVRLDGDYWFRRVFMPFGPTKYAECTVPTIPLEGLAYLPPAIIDDVRKASRYSRTAAWRPLPYEAGRYAYTVVNVSDLFDINRLRADEARDSGLNRITLATLCSQTEGDPFDINVGTASTLQNLLDKWSSSGYDTPFVSLADFNLLAGNGSDFAPFMKYVGKTTASMLSESKPESANALFITDTWFPPATSGNATGGTGSGAIGQTGGGSGGGSGAKVFDLASNAQPFQSWTARGFSQVLSCLNTDDSQVKDLYEKNLGIGLVSLYDYLDSDSKPVSLALPTTEAVPMVTGVSCPAMLKPELDTAETREGQFTIPNPNAGGEDEPANLTIKRTCTQVKVASFGRRVTTKVLVSYPFKRMAKTQRREGHNFNLRGLLKVWAAPADMGCRPVDDQLNLSVNDQNLWRNGATLKNGVATFYSESASPNLSGMFSSDVMKTDDALNDQCVLTFSCDNITMPVLWKIKEEGADDKAKQHFQTKEYKSLDGLRDNQATFRPLKADGAVDGDWKTAAARANAQLNENANQGGVSEFDFAGEYRLYAAVYLQVLDGSDVVDMVPATIDSDIEFLGADNSMRKINRFVAMTGDGSPLLNFLSDTAVKFADIEGSLGAGTEATFSSWKTLYAVDPRYNYAPENWFGKNANTLVSAAEWKQEITPLLGQNGCDRDIFMFVSDQEYLQDIGELQFLPALADFDGSASFLSSYSPDFNGRAFSTRTSANTGAFANGGDFWRTYTAYDNGNGTDPIYALPPNGTRVHSGVGGFKLNPYSDDARVLAAAFAATPFDYYVASTNSNQTQSGGTQNSIGGTGNMSLSSQLNQYSFGECDVAKMDPDDMSNEQGTGIMDAFRDVFQEQARNGDRDWLANWNSLDWQENNVSKIHDANDIFIADAALKNASSCPLHQVDRKFLYSYWRECFDNRQQLFLIFVRAEPATSASGAVAMNFGGAQLGGRAVALVWRDPAVPSYATSGQRKTRSELDNLETCMENRANCAPHRTRILFYHQFD